MIVSYGLGLSICRLSYYLNVINLVLYCENKKSGYENQKKKSHENEKREGCVDWAVSITFSFFSFHPQHKPKSRELFYSCPVLISRAPRARPHGVTSSCTRDKREQLVLFWGILKNKVIQISNSLSKSLTNEKTRDHE